MIGILRKMSGLMVQQAMHMDVKEIFKEQKIFSGAYHIILKSDTDDTNLKNKLNV